MDRRVIWAKAALDDLESVAAYIARDSPRYAATTVKRSLAAAQSLQRLGARGRVVPELQDAAVREVFVGSFRLVYRLTREEVQILAFIHGARDFSAAWRNESGDDQ